MRKRFLSLLLALALAVSLAPQLALYARAAEQTGKCGANLSWSFDDATGALTITGTGAMDDFEAAGNPDWQEIRRQVKTVTLPDGLTSIGNFAFVRFWMTDPVVIPQSVTRIGMAAFNDCDMSAVTIPDTVKTIEYGAFCSCDNLTELKIPGGVSELGEEVFASCTGLTALEIPSNIKTIGDKAFQGCTGLKSVKIPDSVTAIGDNAFCRTGLESVTVGANVKTIGSKAFAECPALSAIEVAAANPNYSGDDGVLCNKAKTQVLQCPCGKTGSYEIPVTATAISEAAFENCDKLTGLTITGNVLSIPDFAFRGCTGITELTLPGSLKTIGWAAFTGCTGLEQIRIPEGVTEIASGAFSGCTGLKAVKIMSKNCVIAERDDTLGVPGSTIIFGHKGSTAETYARNAGYTFKELSQEDDPCALGHDFGEWAQTKDPTCTEGGARTRTCARCNFVEVQTIEALGHDWDEGTVTVEPTETAPGVRTYTCRRCGETKTERIRPTGSTLPEDIDFTNPDDAAKFALAGQQQSTIEAGKGLTLVSTQGGVEPAKQNIAEADHDVVKVTVADDWTATLEVEFSAGSAANGYYQFFAFFASQGGDNQNMCGIRGGDGAMQNFERHDGAITHEDEDGVNSTPGFASAGTYFLRIEKAGDDYTCYRSADGKEFTEMFAYKDSGIEADEIIIDAYTGMTEGYQFTLKSLTFTDGGADVPPAVDKTALEKAIRDYEFITTTNYTPESAEAFQAAVAAGRAIRDKADATQTEVDAAAQAILDAYAALEPLPPEADKTALVTAITNAEAEMLREDVDFTPESEAALIAALDAAKAVNNDPDAAQAEIDKAAADLNAAIDALEIIPDEPPEDFLFDDVKDEGKFYFAPVYWAYYADPQITNGVDATHFGPDNACTRGHVVTFLWRAAGCPAPEKAETPFTDLKPGAFYEKAVAWAVEKGITNGKTATSFAPDDPCNRGQIVTFLWRFALEEDPKSAETPFTDLKPGAFYEKAVAWAVENEVTNGLTATTFDPDATCTRGQVVTFLYRATAE